MIVLLNAFNNEPYALYPYKIDKIAKLKNPYQLTVSQDEKHLFVGSDTSIYHLNLIWSKNLFGVTKLSAYSDYDINFSIKPTGVWLNNTRLYVRTNTQVIYYDNILNKTKEEIPYLKHNIVKILDRSSSSSFGYIKVGFSDLLYSSVTYIHNKEYIDYIISFNKTGESFSILQKGSVFAFSSKNNGFFIDNQYSYNSSLSDPLCKFSGLSFIKNLLPNLQNSSDNIRLYSIGCNTNIFGLSFSNQRLPLADGSFKINTVLIPFFNSGKVSIVDLSPNATINNDRIVLTGWCNSSHSHSCKGPLDVYLLRDSSFLVSDFDGNIYWVYYYSYGNLGIILFIIFAILILAILFLSIFIPSLCTLCNIFHLHNVDLSESSPLLTPYSPSIL